MVLNHILDLDPGDFLPLEDASPTQLLTGQAETALFLKSLGADDTELSEADARAAREAFAIAVNPEADAAQQRKAILLARTPAAVRHLAGMLSQYDWDFVEQAKELRGYVVAKLIEETKAPDPKIRLKALKLLGDVTEVGAFTERVEVVKRDATGEELERRVKEKLEKLAKMLPAAPAPVIEDVTPKDKDERPAAEPSGPDEPR